MRKLRISEHISLDGVIQVSGDDGDFPYADWTAPYRIPAGRDLDAWRKSIMTEFDRVNRELRTAIVRWPDDKLDRLQLPHPLVGKLTVREMLFFTLYHQRHHIDVVSRRLREAQSIPNGDAARSPRR